MDEKKIKIYVDEQGKVVEVRGLPEGYDYKIVIEQEDEEE